MTPGQRRLFGSPHGEVAVFWRLSSTNGAGLGLLRGLVDFFVDAPVRLPADSTGMHSGLRAGSLEAAAVAVRYVSGMTDRYALGLGVELLGWRPEDLPRGV